MAPRPRWYHQLQASKNEALLAVDLYNRSGHERQMEAFTVHMSMAWLKLMQAKTDKDGGSVYALDRRSRRQRHADGGWLTRSAHDLSRSLMTDQDPRRANLDFFAGLRNMVEHRYDRDLASVVSGRTQAYVLNYESTLTEWFGAAEGLGPELRFPIFVSTFSDDAVAAVKKARSRVPKATLDWVRDFDAGLAPGVHDAPQFDFRVYLIPHTGPKTEADAAMTFVHLDQLDAAQRAVVDQVQTIIREKQVPVANLGRLKPAEAAAKVAAGLGRAFSTHHHTMAWKHYEVRPPAGDPKPEVTRSQFCIWDAAFTQHVYTEAWVSYLIRHLADPATFDLVTKAKKVT